MTNHDLEIAKQLAAKTGVEPAEILKTRANALDSLHKEQASRVPPHGRKKINITPPAE